VTIACTTAHVPRNLSEEYHVRTTSEWCVQDWGTSTVAAESRTVHDRSTQVQQTVYMLVGQEYTIPARSAASMLKFSWTARVRTRWSLACNVAFGSNNRKSVEQITRSFKWFTDRFQFTKYSDFGMGSYVHVQSLQLVRSSQQSRATSIRMKSSFVRWIRLAGGLVSNNY